MSAAQLTLRQIHDQASGSIPKKDDTKPGDVVTGQPAKGKPRLLLMGQRRFVLAMYIYRLESLL